MRLAHVEVRDAVDPLGRRGGWTVIMIDVSILIYPDLWEAVHTTEKEL